MSGPKFSLHEFTVKCGRRAGFPIDMLRYDGCWPADGDAVAQIDVLISGNDADRTDLPPLVSVHLRGIQPPTTARWRSFGFVVAGSSDD